MVLAYHPATPDWIPRVPKKISEEKLLMLLRLINSAGLKKVDSGMKMFWLVASQYYEKLQHHSF